MYPVKSVFYDVADQVVVLEESCVFYLKFIVKVPDSELGICFAYESSYTNFACQ